MFPPTAADANVIRYRIYFAVEGATRGATQTIPRPTDADGAADRGFVEARAAAYVAFIEEHTQGFLWHKHALVLTPRALQLPSHERVRVRSYCLEGVTDVGDAIDDEWVVTWLLRELSRVFAADGLVVQVQDTDGEFLLIECAEVLPEWVDPDTSGERVFVRDGLVHLVPPTAVPEMVTSLPHLERRRPNKSTADHGVSHDAKRMSVRAGSLRAVLDDHLATHAPRAMQMVLDERLAQVPTYLRSNRHRVCCLLPPTAVHVLRRRPELVSPAIEAFYYREPKAATAVCSRMRVFAPDVKPLRRRLVTLTRGHYAQLRQQQFFPPRPFQHWPSLGQSDGQTPSDRAADVGMKLVCGLELLYATNPSDQHGRPWRDIIDETLRVFDAEETVLLDEDKSDEDDDSWLYVHPENLEERLQRFASTPSSEAGGAEELQEMASMFNNFVSGVSGVEGVDSTAQVDFDVDAFMSILNGTARTKPEGKFEGLLDSDDEAEDSDEENSDEVDSDDEIQPEDEDARMMREAMAEMDAELQDTTISKTFARVTEEIAGVDSNEADSEGVQPLNLDFNMLSNLLESMASQEGMAGPVSNILSELAATSSKPSL